MINTNIRGNRSKVIEFLPNSDFEVDFNNLKSMNPNLEDGVIGCHLCNFDDKYICREYNDGCKNYDICKRMEGN